MPAKVEELPNDVEQLKKIVTQLQEQNAILRHKLFGRSSDKKEAAEDLQGRLFNESEEEAGTKESAVSKVIDVLTYKRKKAGRKPIRADLPRNEIVLDLSEAEKICACGARLQKIGTEESEELEVIPQQFIVNKYIRPKYACQECEGLSDESKPAVKTAPLKRLLPGSIAGPGLLAYIMISKFCDALPFYRLEKIFERHKFRISRSNMCNWLQRIAKVCEKLRPVLLEEIRKAECIGVDETTVQVLKEEGRKPTAKSYMFVVRGNDRNSPLIYYEYRRTREAHFLKKRLRNFCGTVLSDGYSGYNMLEGIKGVQAAGRMSDVNFQKLRNHQVLRKPRSGF